MDNPAGLALQPDPSRYTLPRFLDDVAERHGGRVALRFEGRSFSYREVHALARELARERRLGMYGSYGISETFTLATALDARAPAALRRRTSGELLAGNELRIVDPKTGRPLPTGETGEIALRGLTLMAGYAKVADEQVFDADGWFRTRDSGFVDAEGRLHWKGRPSALIKTGGANVSPLEIEQALAGFPGVRAAHAVGVPHPTQGEALVLCVIPTAEVDSIDLDAVRSALDERLARYKRPRAAFVFGRDEVAYTGSQKVKLEELRARVKRRLIDAGTEIAGHVYRT